MGILKGKVPAHLGLIDYIGPSAFMLGLAGLIFWGFGKKHLTTTRRKMIFIIFLLIVIGFSVWVHFLAYPA